MSLLLICPSTIFMWYNAPGLQIWVLNPNFIFLFLNQNIDCGYSKEPSQWDGSFEHPKSIFKLMFKKIITILCTIINLIIWTYVTRNTGIFITKMKPHLMECYQINVMQSDNYITTLVTLELNTADPGVASSIPARSHTFVEIDHEIISTVILLPSADSFKKGCCQLQAKVCAQITG